MTFADVLTPEVKAEIDALSHEEMALMWVDGKLGDRLLSGAPGDYFFLRLNRDFGGLTLSVLKRIGRD